VLVAHSRPTSPEVEAGFERWYDELHVPEFPQHVPGIVAAGRLRLAAGQPPRAVCPHRGVLMVYESEADDVDAVVSELMAALRDGRLELSDTLDRGDAPLQLFVHDEKPHTRIGVWVESRQSR